MTSPRAGPKAKSQTGSKRQLRNAGVKISDTFVEQATSLVQPAGLRRSDRLKRKVESSQYHAEADITVSQPNKRACTAVLTVGMDEEQPRAAFPADAAMQGRSLLQSCRQMPHPAWGAAMQGTRL